MACAAGGRLPQRSTNTGTGSWSEIVNSTTSLRGRAAIWSPRFKSSSGQGTLGISNTLTGSWTVKARKNDVNWPSGVNIAVKRTGGGSGFCTISGGTSYLTLTTADQTLFSGSLNRSGIPLQLKTEGLSVSHAPNTYSLNAIYTLQCDFLC